MNIYNALLKFLIVIYIKTLATCGEKCSPKGVKIILFSLILIKLSFSKLFKLSSSLEK